MLEDVVPVRTCCALVIALSEDASSNISQNSKSALCILKRRKVFAPLPFGILFEERAN
jgi:hypothetical protein